MTGTTAVVLSGGIFHDFSVTSAALVEILTGAGIALTIETDVDAVLAGLDTGLLVVNCLRRNEVELAARDRDEAHLELG